MNSERPLGLLVLALIAGLPACAWDPIPRQQDINVNGIYLGRIIGSNNQSALLDVTIVEKDRNVSATVTSQTTRETFTLTGTRSIYDASPVRVNATANIGSGSTCPGGFKETYAVDVSFYISRKDSGTGYVTHALCNALSDNYERSEVNSGSLELVRK